MNTYSKTSIIHLEVNATVETKSLTGKCKSLLLVATQDCWVAFSTTVSTTTGFFVKSGVPYDIPILYAASIAVIRDSANGVLTVTEYGDARSFELEESTSTVSGDGNLLKTVSADYTADANLKRTDISATFTGDASLKMVIPGTFTADSSLLRTVAATATADSNLKKTVSSSITADASLKAVLSTTLTGDASLKAVISSTFAADASLKSVETGTFTADANLQSTESATFTGDSKLVNP